MLRNLLRVADFLPLFYMLGLISMMINRDFKRLGDIAAGTVVVYREKPSSNIDTIPDIEPTPLPLPLSLTEQRAVLDFAERHQDLSASRQSELADYLQEYTQKSGDDSVKALHGYANWLMKGQ